MKKITRTLRILVCLGFVFGPIAVACGGGGGLGTPCKFSTEGAGACASGVCVRCTTGNTVCTGPACTGTCGGGASCITVPSVSGTYCFSATACQ